MCFIETLVIAHTVSEILAQRSKLDLSDLENYLKSKFHTFDNLGYNWFHTIADTR